MNESIKKLKKDFIEIKQLGYIKSINNFSNGGGITLEKLLNANAGNLCYPDLNGIELKTINQYWKKNINLFCDKPLNKSLSAIKYLTSKYGYPDKKFNSKKILNVKVNSKYLTQVGLLYYFKLQIDKTNKIIKLQIFNLQKKLMNDEIYWNFDSLQKKLEIKLKYLALIYLEKKYVKGTQYCKYNKLIIYKLKDFNIFIELIEQGIIEITISTGYTKNRKFHDHGTKFTINEKNIKRLFTRIDSY